MNATSVTIELLKTRIPYDTIYYPIFDNKSLTLGGAVSATSHFASWGVRVYSWILSTDTILDSTSLAYRIMKFSTNVS